jgi:hypothetical protein
VRDKIRAYAWIGGDRPDEIAARPASAAEQGFSAVKMNATAELDWIGTPKLFDEVLERVQAAQGRASDVGLDFHGRVHKPMAKQLAKRSSRSGLLFIEEPLLSENVEGLAQIAVTSRHADRARRAALLALGLQALSSNPARSTSSSRTSAMPAACSNAARSRPWRKLTTSPSRRIARSARLRSPPACSSRPAPPMSRSRR